MAKQARVIEYMDLDEVKPAKRNPKRHDTETIKASYSRFGAHDSPVLDERTKRLLSGHGRIEALLALRDAGKKPPAGIEVDGDKWLVPVQRGGRTKNDKEAEAYILAANKLTELGGWDDDLLSEILADMDDFEGVGFDMPELDSEPDAPEPEDDGKDDTLPRGKRKAFKTGQAKKVGDHRIICADCIEHLRTLPSNSVDAIVTDPPYGIGFMGKDWDVSVPGEDWARECLRVLKPGGHIIAFAATRTVHRLAVAIEDAGFEIRDTISWLYWSGFPKNLDISKAIDKMKHSREEVLEVTAWIRETRDAAKIRNADIDGAFGFVGMSGHWTSGKSQPAVPTLEQVPTLLEVLGVEEPPERIKELLLELNAAKGQPGPNWWKRKKTGTKTGVDMKKRKVAASLGAQGAVEHTTHEYDVTESATAEAKAWEGWGTALKPCQEPAVLARKPFEGTVAGNVLAHGTGGINIEATRMAYGDPAWPGPGDKPEWAGPQGMREAYVGGSTPSLESWDAPSGGRWPGNIYVCPKPASSEKDDGQDEKNFHPTVKPVRLMRWLLRLVTPPGGTVIDTFLGSGTTMVAAEREGFACVGIEQDGEFAALSEARVRQAIKSGGQS